VQTQKLKKSKTKNLMDDKRGFIADFRVFTKPRAAIQTNLFEKVNRFLRKRLKKVYLCLLKMNN
jgi:hypothetical protein